MTCHTNTFDKVDLKTEDFLFRWGLFHKLEADVKAHCIWYYGRISFLLLFKSFFHDGIFSTFLLRFAESLSKYRLTVIFSALLYWLLKVLCHMVVGCGASFGPGLVLLHPFGVSIHKTVRAGNNLVIQNSITLGGELDKGPQIGDNVFVGVGARVLGPVTIGDRCRIGANAVVMFSVRSDYVAAGNPARQIPITNDIKDDKSV